ncbi:MAG: hypothetical protein JXO72_05530 [Vicinamibacteria bacterium]|nr:hypothetical protein [Vicinamibacteria bacterium]
MANRCLLASSGVGKKPRQPNHKRLWNCRRRGVRGQGQGGAPAADHERLHHGLGDRLTGAQEQPSRPGVVEHGAMQEPGALNG